MLLLSELLSSSCFCFPDLNSWYIHRLHKTFLISKSLPAPPSAVVNVPHDVTCKPPSETVPSTRTHKPLDKFNSKGSAVRLWSDKLEEQNRRTVSLGFQSLQGNCEWNDPVNASISAHGELLWPICTNNGLWGFSSEKFLIDVDKLGTCSALWTQLEEKKREKVEIYYCCFQWMCMKATYSSLMHVLMNEVCGVQTGNTNSVFLVAQVCSLRTESEVSTQIIVFIFHSV